LLGINEFARTNYQEPTKTSATAEIRAALCDVDNRDFAAAQKRVEKVLQSDPRNLYAQKLLPAVMARQVKIGDNSAANIALIRKAIEAFQRAANNPEFTAEERVSADKQVLVLYGQISREEQRDELLRRVSDSHRTPRDRAELNTVLASQFWDCAYQITENNPAPGKSQMEKAKQCVTSGLGHATQAITLDGDNETAWDYKANLLKEASKLAGIEDNQTEKAAYERQADEAQKRALAIHARQEAERQNKDASQQEESNKAFTTKEAQEMSKELTEYKRETSLDEAVKEIYEATIELTTLVAPVPIAQVPAAPESNEARKEPKPTSPGCFREIDGRAQVEEKRNWKTFAPEGEDISVDLPDNICSRGAGYIAASEGVTYSIFSLARPPIPLESTVVDGVLNTLARTFVGFRSSAWLTGGNSFEARLLRSQALHDHPIKVYSYTLISCAKRKEGTLIVYAGKTHYYTVDVSGASETDPRVQRFLSSVRFK
jgi:hypothetical protein